MELSAKGSAFVCNARCVTWWGHKVVFNGHLGCLQELLCTVPFCNIIFPEVQVPEGQKRESAFLMSSAESNHGVFWSNINLYPWSCGTLMICAIELLQELFRCHFDSAASCLPIFLCSGELTRLVTRLSFWLLANQGCFRLPETMQGDTYTFLRMHDSLPFGL